MRYHGTITWNGAAVFEGTCSAVIANTLLQHMRENFAGTTFNHLATVLPTLKMLASAKPGDSFRLPDAGDDTGRFGYIFTCIAFTTWMRGDHCQVRDKRDGQLAIAHGVVAGMQGQDTVLVREVLQDGSPGLHVGVPISCVEPEGV